MNGKRNTRRERGASTFSFQNVSIIGLGVAEAPHRVTSAQLGEYLAPTLKRFGMKPNVIEALTGIVARRFWDPEVKYSDVATVAAEHAIEDARIDRSLLGVLISTSVCKDCIEPAMSALVHGNLGLEPECLNFDVGNACLGFMDGMHTVGNMIERGQVDYGIIVDGEGSRYVIECTLRRLLEPDCDMKAVWENFATLTTGSGGGAMVLAHSDVAPEGHRLIGGLTLAATQHNRLCIGQPECMITDACALTKAGLELAAKTWALACKEFGWDPDYFDMFILHQTSRAHIEKIIRVFGISEDRVFKTYPEYGNVGPANIPITLAKAVQAKRVNKGNKVGLGAISSGLNCSVMEVVW